MSERLSKEEREKMRRLAETATDGPWYEMGPPWGEKGVVLSGSDDPHAGSYVCDADIDLMLDDEERGSGNAVADAAYIAYANPERVLRLLEDAEEAERLRRTHENLWKTCGNYFEACGEARSKENLDSYWQKMYEAWQEASVPDAGRGG